MSKLEIGKFYTTDDGRKVLIMNKYTDAHAKFFGLATSRSYVGVLKERDSSEWEIVSYDVDGKSGSLSGYHIGFKRTITIDGKDIEISEESFQELKKQLTEG